MKRKSMKGKINRQFIGIILLIILGMTILLTAVFYNLLRKEVISELRAYTLELKNLQVFENIDMVSEKETENELRITVINADGTVIFDNETNIRDMDNHGTRPEVSEAFDKGEGYAIRKSNTEKKDIFYYAVLLDNNTVLRVAKEAGSVWNIVEKSVPFIVVIIAFMIAVTTLSARYLTKSIVLPIEQMAKDMDHMELVQGYEEVQPLIDTIREQHADIIQSTKTRQEFTANVSHELKTPLTAISGYAELIENGMVNESDVCRFAKEIHSNAKRLLALINDIIHLSELDSGECELEKQEVDLYELAENTVNMLQFHAEKQDVMLSFWGEHGKVWVNETMIEEVIYNLIDNAIRYNRRPGTVDVIVKNTEKTVEISVTDTGIGISKENQGHIFERFYRVDKSHSRETGGTGLGLAIVKHILDLHDADLMIDSTLGVGTKMTVILTKSLG